MVTDGEEGAVAGDEGALDEAIGGEETQTTRWAKSRYFSGLLLLFSYWTPAQSNSARWYLPVDIC